MQELSKIMNRVDTNVNDIGYNIHPPQAQSVAAQGIDVTI